MKELYDVYLYDNANIMPEKINQTYLQNHPHVYPNIKVTGLSYNDAWDIMKRHYEQSSTTDAVLVPHDEPISSFAPYLEAETFSVISGDDFIR